MTTFQYAAYGSNLHPIRLNAADRCPTAKLRGTCVISGWRLQFRKRSLDGSAKCDAEKTGNRSDRLHVAVFDIPISEAAPLDTAEGLGKGYHEETISLILGEANVSAKIYLADDNALTIDDPFDWYKEMVILGAQYHSLPESYVSVILDVSTKTDPKESRAERKWREIENMRSANKRMESNG